MPRFPQTPLLALLFAAVPVHAAGLPDTGQDTCYNSSGADGVPAGNAASIARDAGTHPRQDCRYGPDPAAAVSILTKTGAGAKGFDYTKIANNGTALAAGAALGTGATDWACTKDNVTGLIWEVKNPTSTHLRYHSHTYAWYNTDSGTNGGNAGNPGTNSCNTTLPGPCNTEAYVARVNLHSLCNHSDWRLPTRRELQTLVDAGGSNPAIDPTYFPNTRALSFWSASSYVKDPAKAWFVAFDHGHSNAFGKTNSVFVRLVRGGQF